MNPYAPPDAVAPPVARAEPRTWLTVFGAVQCAFGALGTLSAPLTLASRKLAQAGPGAGAKQIDEILWGGDMGTFMLASLVVGTLFALLLIAAGFGVIKRRGFGRSLSLVHGVGTLLMQFASQAVMVIVVYPRLIEAMDTSNAAAKGAAIGGLVGGVVGMLFGMILPLAEIIVMLRASVKAEFGAA